MSAPIRVYHHHSPRQPMWWWSCRRCFASRAPRWWGPDMPTLAAAADAGRQHLREVHGG